MNDRIALELPHLIRLSQTHPNWYAYAMDKAQRLANQDQDYRELPLLLSNALRLKKHGPPRPSTKPRSE